MIVKVDRDGSFYVAGDTNWRLAGPFPSANEAWGWIDRNDFRGPNEATQAPGFAPRYERQRRTNSSVLREEVQEKAPNILRRQDLSDKERGFVMGMLKRSKRRTPKLMTTDRQANWWVGICLKYGESA